MDLYDAGLAYMRAGLAIFALDGKRPNVAVSPHWLDEPFRAGDEDQWRDACRHAQTTGIGLPVPAHLCVIDIDGEEGAVSFQRLTDGRVPETAVARTGRGLHFWFVSPRVIRSFKIAEKLDCKGYAGYVAAPPSQHPDGGRYEWLWPLINAHGVIEADWLPESIEAIVEAREDVMTLATESHGGSIDGLVRHLERQEPGGRNSTLYWAACAARDDGTPLAEAGPALAGAAVKAGLTKREAMATIRSAYRGGNP